MRIGGQESQTVGTDSTISFMNIILLENVGRDETNNETEKRQGNGEATQSTEIEANVIRGLLFLD